MGKVTGFMEYERVEEGYAPVPQRLKHYKEFVIGLGETEVALLGRAESARRRRCLPRRRSRRDLGRRSRRRGLGCVRGPGHTQREHERGELAIESRGAHGYRYNG